MLSDSFIYVHVHAKSVIEMFQLQGCISELNFGYTAKMGGYAT